MSCAANSLRTLPYFSHVDYPWVRHFARRWIKPQGASRGVKCTQHDGTALRLVAACAPASVSQPTFHDILRSEALLIHMQWVICVAEVLS